MRDVAERFIAKSGGEVRIVMVSTPNKIEGLYQKMEREEPSLYEKIFLDWTWGYNKIYTPEAIRTAMKSPQL